jgi:hypothetical protein
MKELRFEIPEGYIVDFDKSDFENGYVRFDKLPDQKILYNNMSLRLFNGLTWYYTYLQPAELERWEYDEMSIGELSKISIKEFSKSRNVGKVTIKELQEFCLNQGIFLRE